MTNLKIIRTTSDNEVIAICANTLEARDIVETLNNARSGSPYWERYQVCPSNESGLSRDDVICAALDSLDDCVDTELPRVLRSRAREVLELLIDRARDLP